MDKYPSFISVMTKNKGFSKEKSAFPYEKNSSEYKYYQLFNSIDEGYCVIDVLFDNQNTPYDYRFLEVNSAFEQQTGLANPVGRHISEIAPAHEPYWFEIYGQVALTGEPLRFQQWAHRFSRHYDVYAFRIGAPEERQVAVLFNDITEKKRAENNLSFLFDITQSLLSAGELADTIKTVGARMGSFLSLSHFLFSEANTDINGAEVLYSWHQPGTPNLPGIYRLDDYLDHKLQVTLYEGDCLAVNNTITDAHVNRTRFRNLDIGSFVTVPLRRNNEWKFSISLCRKEPYNWRSDEISLIREAALIIWTSLERKRIERDLYHSEERLRMAVTAGKVGICDLDFQTMQAVCNPVRFAMYGMKPMAGCVPAEEFLARTHPEDVEKLQRAVMRGIAAEGKYSEEFRVVHPDGSLHWICETGQVTEWDNDKPQRLVSTLLDITQRKLEEGQRDDFFSIASHELKTPVTNLKAIAYLLKDHFAETNDDFAGDLLVQFEKQTQRLNRLILTMLDAAKAVTGKLDYGMQTIDVLPLLQEVIDDLQCTTPAHRLTLSSPALPFVCADPERLVQVFTNIIANAIKYTPVLPGAAPAEISIAASCTGAEINITVTDTGIGMTPGTVKCLFQRFFRSDNPETHKYPGTGLGLFISKEIMQHHGGNITVQSEKGKGSVFTLTLPVLVALQ